MKNHHLHTFVIIKYEWCCLRTCYTPCWMALDLYYTAKSYLVVLRYVGRDIFNNFCTTLHANCMRIDTFQSYLKDFLMKNVQFVVHFDCNVVQKSLEISRSTHRSTTKQVFAVQYKCKATQQCVQYLHKRHHSFLIVTNVWRFAKIQVFKCNFC